MPAVRLATGRLLGTIAAMAVALVVLAGPAVAQTLPPSQLRVLEVGEFSVNVTFVASPSPDVESYRIYASDVNGSLVNELRPPQGITFPYDRVYVTAPVNVSALSHTPIDPRFWFRNASQADWILGFEDPLTFRKYVPADATDLAYRLSGLAPNVTVFIAVTAVDIAGVENPIVSPVSAVPLSQPVPVKPQNEGILLAWFLIIAFVLAAILGLARTEGRKNRAAYLYILPPMLGLAALTFFPVLFGILISFTNRTGSQTPTFNLIGVENYVRVFAQPDFVMVLTTTLVWTVVNVFFHVSLGLVLAVLLNRKLRGRVVYRALLLLPWAVPSYITTLAWRGMFETHQGLVNALLGPWGWGFFGCGTAPCQWLTATSSPLPLIAVIITNVWLGFPFMMMVFSGGLQGISPELYEAADVDGLSPWQKFRHITLPLLKPTIVPASLLGFIWTFNMFNVIFLMTQGRPPVPGMRAGATDILITYVYRVGFLPPFEQGFAAAYSVIIFLMLLGFGLFYTRYTGAFAAVAGEKETPTARKGKAPLKGLQRFWKAHVARPLRDATSPDQPSYILVHPGLSIILAALGVTEILYAVGVYLGMAFWFVVDVVHAAWFFMAGAGLVVGGVALALRQRAGRRIGTWALLFELLGGAFAFLASPLEPWNLRLVVAGLLLGWMSRPVQAYAGETDPWTRIVDRFASMRIRRTANPGRTHGGRWTNLLIHALLIPFSLLTILPLFVVFGTAFGQFPAMGLVNTPLLREALLPGQVLPGWTTEHFEEILFRSAFPLWLKNSILVSVGTTGLGLLLATTGAYGFSRFQFRGKRWSMLSFIVVQMFPGAIILIPYYVLMFQLGLINQLVSLVIMYSVTALPFVLWFLKGFFDTIPVDLEEAAMVDGATRAGALWRIIVPLALPAIAVAALFSFLSAWNEWLLAFTFMTSSSNYTLPVGVTSFVNPPQVFWNEFAAISVLVSLPVAFLFIIFQKYLVSGLTKGGVKG